MYADDEDMDDDELDEAATLGTRYETHTIKHSHNVQHLYWLCACHDASILNEVLVYIYDDKRLSVGNQFI